MDGEMKIPDIIFTCGHCGHTGHLVYIPYLFGYGCEECCNLVWLFNDEVLRLCKVIPSPNFSK
jgi:hypothetical protein